MDDLLPLSSFPNLKSLNMLGNPIADDKGGDFKKEVLILLHEKLPKLKMINKEEVTQENIEEAKAEKIERIKQAEEERKQAEEEARLAAEKEANGENEN